MAHVITAVIAIALIVGTAVTLMNVSLSAADEISASWDRKAERSKDIARTDLTLIQADISGAPSEDVDISFRNTGQTPLKDFALWDVIVRYYGSSGNGDLSILSADYTTTDPPPANMWTVEGIYTDVGTSEAEVYEPNVFNPGEEMIVRVRISPAVPAGTDNLVTIGVDNGVTLSAPFTR